MRRQDPFAAFLAVRPPKDPISPGSRYSSPKAAGQRGLEALDEDASLHEGPLEVSRLEPSALSIDLEENPFASYLSMRPAKDAHMTARPEPTVEEHLREEVLKTKKQLLQVALQMELEAADPESSEETVLRLRRLKKAQRYLLHPERTDEPFSGSEEEDEFESKTAFRNPRDRKPKRDMATTWAGGSRRWSVGSVYRQPPPDLKPSLSMTGTGQGWPKMPGMGSKDATGLTEDTFALSSSGPFRTKEDVSTPSASRSMGKKDKFSMSAPDLGKPGHAETTITLPPLGAASSKRPMGRDWEGDLLVDEESDCALSAWYAHTRSWNILISKKDLRVSRRTLQMPGGSVVLGDGRIPLFSGSHLLSTGYYYAFQIDAIDDKNYPLETCGDLSFAFGVSHLPGAHKRCSKPVYAYEVPGTILVGYGSNLVDMGEWYTQKTWDPKVLCEGDVVGVLLSPHGDLVVFVNGKQVFRAATSICEGNKQEMHPRRKVLGPRRTLFPVVDLHGRVSAVTLLPKHTLPNINLQARNKITAKDPNPLATKGRKAVPVPGRSLPGVGKAQPMERSRRDPVDEF